MINARVEEFLQDKIGSGGYSGASILFGKPGDVKFEAHVGTIGRGFSEMITASTLFDLQSITKAVGTAPLFYQLWRQSKVELSDRVAAFLPKSVLRADSPLHEITFHQLLTHSSGLSDADLSGTFASAAELWKQMYSAKSYFAPGSGIEYSDLGYRLLGRALEHVAGMGLAKAIRTLVWEPMRLRELTFNPADKMRTAATPDAHGVIDDEQVALLGGVTGCDGVFGTAHDLFRFASLQLRDREMMQFLNSQVVAGHTIAQSYTDTLAYGAKNPGWEINEGNYNYSGPFQNSRCFEKAGGAGTFLWMDQESQCICVYLTNHSKPKPFDEAGWNTLVDRVDPRGLAGLLAKS